MRPCRCRLNIRVSSVRTRTSARYSFLRSSSPIFGSVAGSAVPSSRITRRSCSSTTDGPPLPEDGLEEEFPGTVGGPDEGTGGGVEEAQVLRLAPVPVEPPRRAEVLPGEGPRGRPQELPEGHDVDARPPQVPQCLQALA